MATLNIGIKIAGAISANATTNTIGGNAVTVYTVPANSYAILNVAIVSSAGAESVGSLEVGGQTLLSGDSAGSTGPRHSNGAGGTTTDARTSDVAGNAIITAQGIYVGPSQSVVVRNRQSPAGTTTTARLSGVLFSNTQ